MPAAPLSGRAVLAVACAVLLPAAFAGCGDGSGEDRPDASATPQALTVAVDTLPRTLDPARASSVSERAVAAAVHTPLLTYRRRSDSDAAKLEPALARDLPELSVDEKEYRFTLRPGLLYADGQVVTASDVERSIAHASLRAADPEIREVLAGIIGTPSTDGQTLSGVRSDDRTGAIVVRLREPDGRIPLVLADPATAPLPEIPEPGSDALPASTGPLRVARVTDDSVELVENPLRARIATVPAARSTQVSVTDRAVTTAALRRGEIDVDLQPTPGASLPDGVETVEGSTGEVWTLLLAPRAALTERAIRRALGEALDRRLLDAGSGADGVAPACGLLPAYVVGAVVRDDCPPAPVEASDDALMVAGIRLAVPRTGVAARPSGATTPDGTGSASGAGSGSGSGSDSDASSGRDGTSTRGTTPDPSARGTTAALAVVRAALGSAVAAAGEVVADDPAALVADGRADAALVHVRPRLPHPAAWLEPVSAVDALLVRELPRQTAGPLTGSAARWSELERRVVDRAVAIPVGVGRRTVVVGPEVSRGSVLLQPVLGPDLTALRAP